MPAPAPSWPGAFNGEHRGTNELQVKQEPTLDSRHSNFRAP